MHGITLNINFIQTIHRQNLILCVVLCLMTMCINFYDTITPLNKNISYFVQDFKFSLNDNGPKCSNISKM